MKRQLIGFFGAIGTAIANILAAPAKSLLQQTDSIVTGSIFASAIIGGAMVYSSVNAQKYHGQVLEQNQEIHVHRVREAQLRAFRAEIQLKTDFPQIPIPAPLQ